MNLALFLLWMSWLWLGVDLRNRAGRWIDGIAGPQTAPGDPNPAKLQLKSAVPW